MCDTTTDKTATAVLAQERVHVQQKHVMVAELGNHFVGGTWFGSRVLNIDVPKLVTDWNVRKVLKQFTESESFCVVPERRKPSDLSR